MFLRPGGYATITSPEPSKVRLDSRGARCEKISQGTTELDSFGCKHCGRITHVRARQDPAELGGLCKICMGLICSQCVGNGCDPFEKKLERWEAKEAARRSYGL